MLLCEMMAYVAIGMRVYVAIGIRLCVPIGDEAFCCYGE